MVIGKMPTHTANRMKRKIDRPPLTLEMLKHRTAVRVREYSALTGLPEASVYALIYRGELKADRRGHSLLIPKSEVPGLGV